MDSIYTDDIEIALDGVYLSKQDAHVLSIEEGTKVWGLILKPSLSSHEKPQNRRRQTPPESTRQLLLTPVPINAWPVCFQLRMQVDGEFGSLAKALRNLTREGVNVIHVDYGPGGASFSSVDLVCEFPNLRNWANEIKQLAYRQLTEDTWRDSNDYQLLSDYASVIAARVYASMQLVMWRLRLRHTLEVSYDVQTSTHEGTREAIAELIKRIEENDSEVETEGTEGELSSHFLDTRFLLGRRLFSLYDHSDVRIDFLSSLQDDEFVESLDDLEWFLLLQQVMMRNPDATPKSKDDEDPNTQDQWFDLDPRWFNLHRILTLTRKRAIRYERRAVSGSMNAGLLHAWMLDPFPHHNAFQGKYDTKKGMIVLDKESRPRYKDSFEEARVSLPHKGTASFVPGAKYVRAAVIGGESYARRYRIEIDYTVQLGDEPESSSMGLFSAIASALGDFKADISRFESVLNERDSGKRPGSVETGKVIFVGILPEVPPEDWIEALDILEGDILQRFAETGPTGCKLSLELWLQYDV